ncbi:carbohydrate binding family 9 domain-containing protein [Sediminibacterium roseum]|uniref:Carbohydrate binding family 9 domain-containing protein n=1 Tax=Sediminibacterium roseum TaxID=1978412 RepID=A0ABW9ZMK0_9BACT|nr:DUF5916 domain-containing protein [Sediminibacterium roseum]NCI48299.1 carbohydrate binding family 9 domain-containing protein [Sediminibacterium roseum]
MKKLLFSVFITFTALSLCAQVQAPASKDPMKDRVIKKVPAVRTAAKIVIDADLSDEAWKSAPLITDMVEWRPTYGKIEDHDNRTDIHILYDNTAIYISGFCHERSNDSISTELVGRDVVGVNDFVGVIFDTYNDKINGFGYYVTPLGEQFDAKYSSNGEDGSWSSVYESQAKIVPGGWVFEMRIPYSAIRFSNVKKQDWGINITRRNSKSGKQYMWNPTDPTIGGNFFAQFGLWTGIEDIKPPVRLSFSPYLSTYVTHYPYNDPSIKNTATSINGGMDVKYGINQAFTLDMTLIPDFGQVQSDNQVLNTTPFEVKYNENRSFFTEGTELFGKGNLFYSRRIGGEPIHLYDVSAQLKAGESIAKNPTETRLINATKVSGRTSSGLGIGFLNAITNPQYATIESGGKEVRKIETSPLTNYNIIVFDQSLKRNSSISFINTNVTRAGADYDANVSAFLWDLYDKKNDWNLYGKVGASQLIGYEAPGKNTVGYSHTLGIGKTGGRFNMNFSQELTDHKYNADDLGYSTNYNYADHYLWMGYKQVKPKGLFNNLYMNFNGYLSMRYKPWDYQMARVNTNVNGQLKSLWYVGVFQNILPEQNDFYEPRTGGRVFKRPSNWVYGFWFESNNAKKYSVSVEFDFSRSGKYTSRSNEIYFRHQYRFNKRLTLSTNTNISIFTNNTGYATKTGADSVIFALRKRNTVENIFTAKYNFNNKMGLSFRARHYWGSVDNREFFVLKQDGYLTPVPTQAKFLSANNNVNFFNIDMVYTWQFALGSFVNIVWKNSIGTSDKLISQGYFKNADNTFDAPALNSLSVRIIYFLDYLSLKKK